MVPSVDPTTLHRKVMCGYQGWFRCETDGSDLGWHHWGKNGRFEPGSCVIDCWPDVSELDDDEKFPTPFQHADGSVAYVFSSHYPKTVHRHFRWMRDYGIDGAFVQRFGVAVTNDDEEGRKHRAATDNVLNYCREGANRSGRAYAVMYDLSGMEGGGLDRIHHDWRRIVDEFGITRGGPSDHYLHHRGRPVVAIWGVGFDDRRRYSVEETARLVELFRNDATHGPVTLMLGVPTGWRTLSRDAVSDPRLLDIIRQVDIVSPWTVGRYRDEVGVHEHAEQYWKPDVEWCREHGIDYLPVVFPGFSWVNLKGTPPDEQIPREGGRFLWSQYAALKELGAPMVYQAMFDEVDEATQIFKVTNDPPVGASQFRTNEGLPPDHYLWLVGEATKMIRGETRHRATIPIRA